MLFVKICLKGASYDEAAVFSTGFSTILSINLTPLTSSFSSAVVIDDGTSGPNISRLMVTWTYSTSAPKADAASPGYIVPE